MDNIELAIMELKDHHTGRKDYAVLGSKDYPIDLTTDDEDEDDDITISDYPPYNTSNNKERYVDIDDFILDEFDQTFDNRNKDEMDNTNSFEKVKEEAYNIRVAVKKENIGKHTVSPTITNDVFNTLANSESESEMNSVESQD